MCIRDSPRAVGGADDQVVVVAGDPHRRVHADAALAERAEQDEFLIGQGGEICGQAHASGVCHRGDRERPIRPWGSPRPIRREHLRQPPSLIDYSDLVQNLSLIHI